MKFIEGLPWYRNG